MGLVLSLLISSCSPSAPDSNPNQAEKGVVKGRVLDKDGKPVANAVIVASSTDYYNKNSTGYSDASGNYSFSLPTGIAEGSYSVSGTVTFQYQGKNYTMALYPEQEGVFSAYDGAVRNFVFRLNGPRSTTSDAEDMPLGGTLEVHAQPDNVNDKNLEITLEPMGPLVDGSTGKTLVVGLPENDYRIKDIPVGKYKITARDKVTGQQLGVAINGAFQDYAPAVEGLFTDKDFEGSTFFDLVININTL
ncbi:carboxypeptidase-like regulatory domain-containing protein [Cytophagaceae bacterium BD1B2-1]|uniref:Carboxypeptidase-like regulatory domain-containing protein n=2 Tax=Xanthocytophaga agilis TaxID=3048010 RepID=A0AAE3UFD5_9BACT|nr:carboxypeptidase-like regulatory domain-containing protein [Xanthocytophaga agilis]